MVISQNTPQNERFWMSDPLTKGKAETVNAHIQEISLGAHCIKGSDLLDYVLNPDIFEIKMAISIFLKTWLKC